MDFNKETPHAEDYGHRMLLNQKVKIDNEVHKTEWAMNGSLLMTDEYEIIGQKRNQAHETTVR